MTRPASDSTELPQNQISADTQSPSSTRGEFGLPLFSAVAAAILSSLMLSVGITVTPDGWAYWEGSVSLLNGLGFRYFGGQGIVDFPPLFPSGLMLVQAVFGVSGYTLAGSLIFLATLTAFLWCRLLVRLTDDSPPSWLPRWLGALYIPAFISAYYTTLLSETLFLAMIAAVVLCLFNLGQDTPQRSLWLWLGGASLAATALLLTRNSGVAFMPGFALLIFLRTGQFSLLKRLAVAAFFTGLPCGIWSLSRTWLRQIHSHTATGQGRFAFFEYVQQFVEDLAYRLGPAWWHFGMLLLIGTLVVLMAVYSRRVANGAAPLRDGRHLLLIAAAAICTLLVLFNVTWIADPLSGRFLWFLPLTLVTTLACGAAQVTQLATRWTILGILLVLFVLQAGRTGSHVQQRLRKSLETNVQLKEPISNVQLKDTISPEH